MVGGVDGGSEAGELAANVLDAMAGLVMKHRRSARRQVARRRPRGQEAGEQRERAVCRGTPLALRTGTSLSFISSLFLILYPSSQEYWHRLIHCYRKI